MEQMKGKSRSKVSYNGVRIDGVIDMYVHFDKRVLDEVRGLIF